MTFDVLLTQKNRKYFAHVRQWPEIIGEGDTEEKALSQAHAELKALLTGGKVVQLDLELNPSDHPWGQFAGMFEDDPDWDEFQTVIQKDREILDVVSTTP
jgi:predicted RNase H-like HicB family nuclease